MAYKKLTLDVIIPAYNGGKTIRDTLGSLLSQSFSDFRVIIHDDCSTDNTEAVVKSFNDPRITFFKNKYNLTCQKNIEAARQKSKADIVYFLCQDDILSEDALIDAYNAFTLSDDIGAVVRPYFWFDEKINNPVRAISRLDLNKDEVVTINDDYSRIKVFIDALGQLSGLSYRRKYFSTPFHEDIFPGHVYPFVSIFKKHPVVFLKNFTVAVRISSSQSRKISSIYEKSPIQSWVKLFKNQFPEAKYKDFREHFIKEYVAVNYLGLIQIKNYSTFKNLLREIYLLIKYRPKNLINPLFLTISMAVIILPPIILIPLVDWYKKTILAKVLPKISFKYKLDRKTA